jgi:signal peptidase II
MTINSSKNLLGDFVRITYIENPGMAFGIDLGGKPYFSIFSIIASIGILLYLYKVRSERLVVRLPLALILGGAIGNLIDRVFYGVLFGEGTLFHGKVVDFIDIQFFDITIFGYHLTRWPVFNIADAAVTIGVMMLIVTYRKFVPEKKHEQTFAEQSPIPALEGSSTTTSTDLPNGNNSGVANIDAMSRTARRENDQTNSDTNQEMK